MFSVAAWFPGGATLSLPYDDSFPAPRRTGLGVLHHPAPSLSPPRFDRSKDPSPSDAIHPRTSFADVLRPRAPARRPSETRRICCHGQNPHCVGPCIARTLSQTAARNASPALPGIDATMDGSDFRAAPPVSSLFIACSRVPAFRWTASRISSVTAYSQCQARHGLGPRGVPAPLAVARYRFLPAGGTNPSALTH